MRRPGLLSLCLFLIGNVVATSLLCGQSPNTIQPPSIQPPTIRANGSQADFSVAGLPGQDRPGTIRPVSAASSPSIVNARRDASENRQIRVTVQYLLVDSETRASIYQGLDQQSIESIVQSPIATEKVELDDSVAPLASFQQIQAPSRVTCYTLDQHEFAEVLKKVVGSSHCEVNVAPKVILLDGHEVEMTDLVQRPFIVDFQVVNDSIEPTVHMMDEGIRLRLVANRSDVTTGSDPTIDLKCELTMMRLLDVKTDQVYGLGDEPLSVQLPIQQVTSAVASKKLAVGQTFLIDPHLSQSKSVTNEGGIPVLNRIPYLSRTFKNTAVGIIQQHLILLLQPAVE